MVTALAKQYSKSHDPYLELMLLFPSVPTLTHRHTLTHIHTYMHTYQLQEILINAGAHRKHRVTEGESTGIQLT